MQREDGALAQSESQQIAERFLKNAGDIALANACARSYQGMHGDNLSFPLSYVLSQQHLPKDMRTITFTEGGEMGVHADIHKMCPITNIDLRCLQNGDFFIDEDKKLQDTATKRALADYYNSLTPEMKIYLTVIVWSLDSDVRTEKHDEISPYKLKYSDLGTLAGHISRKDDTRNLEMFGELLDEIDQRVKQEGISRLNASYKIAEETKNKVREIESSQESIFMHAADYLTVTSLEKVIKEAQLSKPSFHKFISVLTNIEVLIFQSGNSKEKKEKLRKVYEEMERLDGTDFSQEVKEKKYELLVIDCEHIYGEIFSPEFRYFQSSLDQSEKAWLKQGSDPDQQDFFTRLNVEREALLMSDMTESQKNCSYYALAQQCEQYTASLQGEPIVTLKAELEQVFTLLMININIGEVANIPADKEKTIKDNLSRLLKTINRDGVNLDELLKPLLMGKYRFLLSDPRYAAQLAKISPLIANKLSVFRAEVLWEMNNGNMDPAEVLLDDAVRFYDIASQRLRKQKYLLSQSGENSEDLSLLLDECEKIAKSVLASKDYTDLDKVQGIINLARRLSGLPSLPLVSNSRKKSLSKSEAEIMMKIRNVDDFDITTVNVSELRKLLASLTQYNYPRIIINKVDFIYQYALISNDNLLSKNNKRAMLINLLMYYKCFESTPVNMSGCDLSGEVIASVSRHGAIMPKSILTATILRNSLMSGANFIMAKCEGLQVISCNLLDTDFSYANLSRAIFNSASLENACFDNCLLNKAIFESSNLEGVSFMQASCLNAEFSNVNLARVNFTACSLNDAVFDNVDLDGAIFDKADLSGVDLSGSSFANTSMKSTILINPDNKLDSMDWHNQLDEWSKINIPVETAFFNVLMVFESKYNVYSDNEKLEILRVLQFHSYFSPTIVGKHSPREFFFQPNDKSSDQISLTVDSMIKNLEEKLKPEF